MTAEDVEAPTISKTLADSEEEIDDEDDDGDDDDEAMGVEMNVNFDAQTATDADFHGIKRLLQQLFLKV